MIDIFIKTYHKDFVWLEFLLKSIKKFASGFRNVVIVSDEGHLLPEHFHEIVPYTVFYVKVPQTSIPMDHGTGYSWQQYIKLTWYNYTDAEQILLFDSDEMITCPITPESFKTNGRYNWYYQPWKHAGNAICHKPHTDKILNRNTPYESMCVPTFIFTRSATKELEQYLHQLHGTNNIWVIMHRLKLKTISEFNIYGNFIRMIQHSDYNYVDDLLNMSYPKIIQSWSWGGLREQDKQNRLAILNS